MKLNTNVNQALYVLDAARRTSGVVLCLTEMDARIFEVLFQQD